jgi:hypothetical protein
MKSSDSVRLLLRRELLRVSPHCLAVYSSMFFTRSGFSGSLGVTSCGSPDHKTNFLYVLMVSSYVKGENFLLEL